MGFTLFRVFHPPPPPTRFHSAATEISVFLVRPKRAGFSFTSTRERGQHTTTHHGVRAGARVRVPGHTQSSNRPCFRQRDPRGRRVFITHTRTHAHSCILAKSRRRRRATRRRAKTTKQRNINDNNDNVTPAAAVVWLYPFCGYPADGFSQQRRAAKQCGPGE